MSWTTILVIAGGTFAFKATGLFGLGRFADSPTLRALGGLLPAALLSALIVVQTVSIETDLVLDARSAGVVAGGIAAFRSAPFWLVAILAAAVTATVRAV
jgi:hypothetical protein